MFLSPRGRGWCLGRNGYRSRSSFAFSFSFVSSETVAAVTRTGTAGPPAAWPSTDDGPAMGFAWEGSAIAVSGDGEAMSICMRLRVSRGKLEA